MRDVEIGGRLVEQEEARTLTERHCEKDALPLAAREGVHLALCKCGDVRGLHCPRDCLAILRVRTRLKEPCVGKASVGDKLLHRESLRRRTLLRQDGAHARELLFRVAAKLAPIEHDSARIAAVQPRKCAQEGGLARAVRTDNGCAPPCGYLYVQPVEDFLARNLHAQIAGAHPGTHSCLLRR